MLHKLLVPVLLNAVLAVFLYLLERKTAFKNWNRNIRQLVIGILFGLAAAFATEYGVSIDGAVINVRDASTICAALIFGAPAGVISGLIGGLYRWFAVLWGAGMYTRLACTISTVLVGVLAALLRKYMFDDKKPSWIYGLGTGVVCEVIHMLMIFITNMDDAGSALQLVQQCTIPMVVANGCSVCLALMAVSLIGKERISIRQEQKQISQTFQFWLLICIIVAYSAISTFTYMLQSGMSQKETESVITLNIEDVHRDITDASDKNLLNITHRIKEDYLDIHDSSTKALLELAEKYEVSDINIVNANGVITGAILEEFLGYHMASGDQSSEFLVLLDGEEEVVQKYQPTSYDDGIYRKYAAVSLPDGGFIQVGYDAERFRRDIDERVIDATKNRHIGRNGFVAICDEDWKIVIDRSDYAGQSLSTLGILIDPDTMKENTIYEADIYGNPYFYAYAFAEGYCIVGAIPENEAMYMRNVSVYISIFMEIIIFAALFVLIYFLIKKLIIDNIKTINHTLSEITDGNLNATVDVRSNEEFASLSDDINSTVRTLKRYIAEAAARIDKELEFAKQIQYSALPADFPPYPERKEFEIFAQMITAKEVGGDFYDFYLLNQNTFAFLIADVSGKGIPAAMFMMRAKTIIKDLAERGLEPHDVFTEANAKLCENNDAGMFVTAWMGMLDLQTGILRFVNAGHNPPLLKRANGSYEYMKERSGLLLAGMEGVCYRKYEKQLQPGDQLYLYTDGVTEATDKNQCLYGEERLQHTLNGACALDTRGVCEIMKKDVDRFVGEAPQFDDITMLSVKLHHIRNERSVTVIPNKASRAVVEEFAEQMIEKCDVKAGIANKIHIIIDEIYSNIVNYSGAEYVTIDYMVEDGTLHLTFTDNGVAYNPLKVAEPDVTLSAEDREIGGLGIFMVKKLCKHLEYAFEEDKNLLRIAISLR
ncbi:MAG: SpoIIE family protein phosphatase [Lachnospiraceae bacterium]